MRAKIPARRRRHRRLSSVEETALFRVGLVGRRQHLRPIVEVALCTGMRKGELFRLKYEDLNFGPSTVQRNVKGEIWDVFPDWLFIEKTKNGKPRAIPMSQRVRLILKRLSEDSIAGKYIFRSIRSDSLISDIKKAFVTACYEAKIVNLTFHDLRHTWSSRAAEMGVPEHVRRDILGHSSETMTGDYTHASPEEMEHAMEIVAAYKPKKFLNLGKISAKQEVTSDLRSAVAL